MNTMAKLKIWMKFRWKILTNENNVEWKWYYGWKWMECEWNKYINDKPLMKDGWMKNLDYLIF